jgi:glycosyltransferase involved in cell wall biosynthesis
VIPAPTIQNKVSVVLPVHYVNREWLTKSVTSVLKQDYEPLELIVVNDEATEDIDELIRSLGVHKYVKNDRNRKLPYSLNRGFEQADGEFHTWTSVDNYMLPGMVARLVTELKSRTDLAVVCGKSFVMNDAGEFFSNDAIDSAEELALSLSGSEIDDQYISRARLFYGTIGACFLYYAYVWRELNGYDEELHGAEDFDFWLRASRSFKIGRIPWRETPYYAYRVHDVSMSSTISGCFTNMRFSVLERESRIFPDDQLLKKAVAVCATRMKPQSRLAKILSLLHGVRRSILSRGQQ